MTSIEIQTIMDAFKEFQEKVGKVQINSSKMLTAKQAEKEFGISAKTLLNRSNLPAKSRRYIPSVRLQGGRKKYFERVVLERLLQPIPVKSY